LYNYIDLNIHLGKPFGTVSTNTPSKSI
jgi:hypothetical protein